jgi:hypothetical protein
MAQYGAIDGEIMLAILAGDFPTAPPVTAHRQPLAFAGVAISFLGLFLAAKIARLIWQASLGWHAEKLSRPDWPHRTISPAHTQA